MTTQLQMLNKILSLGDAKLISVKELTKEHFPQYKTEFLYIQNHILEYGVVPDKLSFVEKFPDFEIQEVNESTDYLVEELFREKTEAYLIKEFNNIKDYIVAGKTDKAVDLVLSAANNVSHGKRLEVVDILSDTSRYDTYLDKCNNFAKYYISTGLRELDEIIGGWDKTEEYATIIARSGVGKTWMLLKSVTAAVSRGLNIGLYEGEMSVAKTGYRFDTLMSNISNWKLIHGGIDVAQTYKEYLDDLQANHSGHLYILTRDMLDGSADVNALRSFIDKYELDILFIDQHSLLDDARNGRTEFERAANISKDLKILQTTKHIPIITVSQQNRTKVEDGKFAGTENVANSDRIAQDSTVIISLAQEDDIMIVNVTKSRDGGTGKKIKYAIDLDHGKFDYIPELEDDNSGASKELEDRYNEPYYEESPF